jgi:hypothetical protein
MPSPIHALSGHTRQMLHVPILDESGAIYAAVQGAPDHVINVWAMYVACEGDLGWQSSGGRLLVPSGGAQKNGTQYMMLPMPEPNAYTSWFSTDPGDDLLLDYDADRITGFIIISIDTITS